MYRYTFYLLLFLWQNQCRMSCINEDRFGDRFGVFIAVYIHVFYTKSSAKLLLKLRENCAKYARSMREKCAKNARSMREVCAKNARKMHTVCICICGIKACFDTIVRGFLFMRFLYLIHFCGFVSHHFKLLQDGAVGGRVDILL